MLQPLFVCFSGIFFSLRLRAGRVYCRETDGASVSLAMAEPRCFQTQLNSIMEIMSRAVVRQICKIVDSDLGSLRLELERALHDNAALGDKMRVLESEVETLRRARAPRKSCRSVCIQTSEGTNCSPVSLPPSLSPQCLTPLHLMHLSHRCPNFLTRGFCACAIHFTHQKSQ